MTSPAINNGAAAGGVLPSSYRYVKDLGSGAFGVVVLAEDVGAAAAAAADKQQGAAAAAAAPQYVAIKKLPRSLARNSGYALSELLLHSSLRHPHVVRFREVFLSPRNINVVLEYMPDGTLLGHLQEKQHNRLPEGQARWIFQQLLFAVEYIHRKGVANRDIKLENILLDKSVRGRPDWPLMKLADYGYAKSDASSSATSRVGTLTYMAPEVLSSSTGSYSGKAADIWSCGVVLYAMLCGQLPFGIPTGAADPEVDRATLAGSVMGLLADMRASSYKLPEALSPGARDLVRRMLDPDAASRAKVGDITAHPWFVAGLPTGALQANEAYLQLPRSCAQTADEIRAIVARAAEISSGGGMGGRGMGGGGGGMGGIVGNVVPTSDPAGGSRAANNAAVSTAAGAGPAAMACS